MREVPLSEVKDDLSRYLRLAEKEGIVITRHGQAAEDVERAQSFGRGHPSEYRTGLL